MYKAVPRSLELFINSYEFTKCMSKVMKNIFLIAQFMGTHFDSYRCIYSKTLIDLGYSVTVFCPKPNELESWYIQNYPEYKERRKIVMLKYPSLTKLKNRKIGEIINTYRYWIELSKSVRKEITSTGILPDLVFFLHMDNYLGPFISTYLINKIFPFSWSGLYLAPLHLREKKHLLPIRKGILNPDKILKSKFCRSIGILDEGLAEQMKKRIGGKKVIIFPDIADESKPDNNFFIVDEIKKKAGKKKIIGLLGALNRRKNLLKLLKASQYLKDENLFFVFAGKLLRHTYPKEELLEIDNIIKSKPDNCYFYFQRIPDEKKFNAIVEICYALFLVYEDHFHSSNILTKASLFGKIVIANSSYCIGERIKKYGTGIVIEKPELDKIIEALVFISKNELIENSEIKENLLIYKKNHSIDTLKEQIEKIINF